MRTILVAAICLVLAHSPVSAQPRLVAGPNQTNWGHLIQLPREDAIALAFSPEYQQFQPGILNLVFRMWAMEDPGAAHERLLSLPGDIDTGRIEVQIIEAWLRTDPDAAIAAAADSENAQTFEMVLRSYAHLNPVAALAAATEYDARLEKPGWTGIMEGVASRNPELAAQHVASLGPDGTYLIDAFIYGFAREYPDRAMDWLLAYVPQQTHHYDAIASIFYIRNPAEAFEYLEGMQQGAARNAFNVALCQAESVNQASRAASALEQWSYDATACEA